MTPSSLPLAVTLASATPRVVCAAALQRSIQHAERLVDVLRSHEQRARGSEIWLTGRADELQCFLQAVAADWRRGDRSESDAVRAMDDYLDELHRLLALFHGHDLPLCCQAVTEKVDARTFPEAPANESPTPWADGVSNDEDADATHG